MENKEEKDTKKKTPKKTKYTKEMTLLEIIQANEENSITLMGFGLHCCCCPMCSSETLEQACEVHGLDLGFVLARLNNEA